MVEFYFSLELEVFLTHLVHVPYLQSEVVESGVRDLLHQPDDKLEQKQKEEPSLMGLPYQKTIDVLYHVEGQPTHLQLRNQPSVVLLV